VQEADRLGVPVYDYVESLKLSTENIIQKITALTTDDVYE
jgi:hypothetical protein